MIDFKSAPTPQKASPAFVFIYDTATSAWKALETASAGSASDVMDFKDAPCPQKSQPTCLFLYDASITGWRAAGQSDFGGGSSEAQGIFDVPTGSRIVSITGLFMTEPVEELIPSITLIKPASSSDHLTYNVIGDSVTTSGFNIELSAPPTELGYRFSYEVNRA